ncbi:hypothetical protein [Acetatifactor aquisgranensis]|uniref:hypothetical protein n=1 Tax=Acetatifactor aquisgranensis TaxID=2941233 RepID=UPI00203BADDF|nr:hypothetical protein [Acetatifactor aquisgranensis]
MKHEEDEHRRELFEQALKGKHIPVLTLDNKWYQLLNGEAREGVARLEGELNALLKQQGKLNNEVKEIKRLKKRLMGEIVSMMGDDEQRDDSENAQKTEQNKRLVEECNEKLENCQDELLELPREIERVNFQLMLATMDWCYDIMAVNTESIQQTEEWISEIRVELKKRLVRKQEMERHNHAIYSYMHDVFGAEVVDIFDMHHDLDGQDM